jgi:hypothetical protein
MTDAPQSPAPDPYAGMTDYDVLRIAQAAYRRAEFLPALNGQRFKEWDTFDRAMAELMRRSMMHVLSKIRDMEADGEDRDPDDTRIASTILDLIERNGSGTPADADRPGEDGPDA